MNKKVLLGILGLVVLLVSVGVGIILVKQNQDFREKAAPATTMYITPSTQNKNSGDTFTSIVRVDTGPNLVSGVDVRLKFDTSFLEVTSIQKGADISGFDSTITNKIDNNSGTIAYAVFALDKSKAANGSNLEILIVNGKVKSTSGNGTTSLSFDPSTSASGLNEGQNILTGTTGATIKVTSSSIVSTPTATSASSTATATPTPTATSVSSSRTATPTATATSVGSANNRTATPTVRSTATPTPTSTSSSGTGGSSNVTSTPTSLASAATSTPVPIPVTGVSWTTLTGIGIGSLLILVPLLISIF